MVITEMPRLKTHKILGTANPSAATNTNLFTVTLSSYVQLVSLTAANRSANPVTIRIGIDVGGNGTDTPGDGEWLYYDLSVEGNATLLLDVTQGMWLGTQDDLVVYATTQDIAFVASGIEYA